MSSDQGSRETEVGCSGGASCLDGEEITGKLELGIL